MASKNVTVFYEKLLSQRTMNLLGAKKKDHREQLREMQSQIRRESYKLDREIANLQKQVQHSEQEVKRYAKASNLSAARVLAREIVNSRRQISRLHTAKTQMNSVSMRLGQQVAAQKTAGALEKSTDVMKAMSKLVKVPEVQKTMQGLSKQMMKIGLMEEMMDDAFDSAFDNDEVSDEIAQDEVDRILWDITQGAIGKAPDAITDTLPAGYKADNIVPPDAAEEEGDLDEMRARLDALRS